MIQIAGGIILAVVILIFLPSIIAIIVPVFAVLAVLTGLVLAINYLPKEILIFIGIVIGIAIVLAVVYSILNTASSGRRSEEQGNGSSGTGNGSASDDCTDSSSAFAAGRALKNFFALTLGALALGRSSPVARKALSLAIVPAFTEARRIEKNRPREPPRFGYENARGGAGTQRTKIPKATIRSETERRE
jgi:hypothetical protein